MLAPGAMIVRGPDEGRFGCQPGRGRDPVSGKSRWPGAALFCANPLMIDERRL